MDVAAMPLITALIFGALMFTVGFFTGQKAAQRRGRFYDRIREL